MLVRMYGRKDKDDADQVYAVMMSLRGSGEELVAQV